MREHPLFRLEGHDVVIDKFITATQAILGATLNIETLDGVIEHSIEPGTAHGE